MALRYIMETMLCVNGRLKSHRDVILVYNFDENEIESLEIFRDPDNLAMLGSDAGGT